MGIAAATAFFAAALPRLEIRTDGAAIYPPGSTTVAATTADRALFHDPETVLVLIESGGASGLISPAGFACIRAVHDSLASLPGVQGAAVRSIRNWPAPGTLRGLSAEGALDVLPSSLQATQRLADRLREEPLVRGLLLSADGRVAAVEVPFEKSYPRRDCVGRIANWARSQPATPFRLSVLGPVAAEVQLGERVVADLERLVPMMIGAIAILLGIALRTPGGVLVPLVEALLTIVWTLGAMAWLRVPVTLVTTILPVVLMSMAITDEVHLLARLQAHLTGVGDTRQRIVQSVRAAYHDVRDPVLATTLTTAIGFFSFATSPMIPLRDFGIFAGFGILCAMFLTFTLVPALTVVLPVRWFRSRSRELPRRAAFEAAIVRRPTVAALAAVTVVCAGGAGIARLRVQDAWVDNFPHRSDLARAERTYNAHFWGSYRWDIVLEAEPGYFFRPEGLALLSRTARVAADAPGAGGTVTALAPLGSLAVALGAAQPVPELDAAHLAELAAVAQALGSRTGILQLLSGDGAAARIRVHLNSPDYRRTAALRTYVAANVAPILRGLRWHSSGDLPVALEVVHAIVDNQVRSAAGALAGIAVLLLLALRRLDAVAAALVPVSASALFLLGAMGWAGIPLGIATSMFVSLSIGVGLDFALHLMHHYRELRRGGSPHDAAVQAAIERTGRVIRWNAVVLAAGLSMLCFSALKPDRMLGGLLAAAVLSCWAATVLLLPALLRRVRMVAVLACLCLPFAGRTWAAPAPAPAAGDPRLEAAMQAAETAARRGPRAIRMHITTRFAPGQDNDRTVWGVVGGDNEVTRLLFVFTKPDPMRGLTLLIQDAVNPAVPDSAWMYLPVWKYFGPVDTSLQKTMVPGTALTNDDARGFIPSDRYFFTLADSSAAVGSGGVLRIVARPRTVAIREQVGYSELRIRLDEKRSLVERVDFAGLDGKPLKSYEVLEAVQVARTWLPARARVRHRVLDFDSRIDYTYWPLAKSPPLEVFHAGAGPELPLPRLERAIAPAGCRIEPTDAAPAPPPPAR